MPDTESKSFIPESDFTVIGASFAGSLLASKLIKYGSVSLFDKVQPGTRLKCAGGMRAEELVVERAGDQQKVTVRSGGKTLVTGSGPAGKTYSLTFPKE
jgi:hypothetical protein